MPKASHAVVLATLLTLAVSVPLVARAQTCAVPLQSTLITDQIASVVDIRHGGDARLFLVELSGRIWIVQNGSLLATPFLDIRSVVSEGSERGLLSLAFHPSYPATPWFYVLYTSEAVGGANLGDIVVARYNVSADPNVATPSSARVLLTVPHSSQANHNGGQLHFGPGDHFLYISTGDGGGGCDDGCDGQRDDTLLGKLLRIDVNRDTPPYYNIPPSNPYSAPGLPLDEIWAKGLRNPFRFSFDRQTSDLWIGDVGQAAREEIDFQPAGAEGGRNYGWPVMEGSLCRTCALTDCPGAIPDCADPVLIKPVHDYDRQVGTTVIGGYRYRGASMPALRGCYVFGDNGGGSAIWAIDPAQPGTRRTLLANVFDLTTFGEDSAGELYAAYEGKVYRLRAATTPPAVPALPDWALLSLGGALFASASKRRRRLGSAGH